jgi:hypothetical protein
VIRVASYAFAQPGFVHTGPCGGVHARTNERIPGPIFLIFLRFRADGLTVTMADENEPLAEMQSGPPKVMPKRGRRSVSPLLLPRTLSKIRPPKALFLCSL